MSAKLVHVETNALGVTRRFYCDEHGNMTVEAEQDLQALVDRNKSMQVDNGKTITSDYSNPIATIPPIFVLKWLNEEGWYVYDADKCPDADKKLKQKLNDPDWRWLRTSELRV